jgi:hypothetical protein
MDVHCNHCGVELGANAMFCSNCGNALGALGDPAPAPAKSHDWELHISILGWLVIAHAALTAVIGLVVIFGGQIAREVLVSNPGLIEDADDLPPGALAIIGPITFIIGVIFLVISMPSIAAGVGLLRYRSWGRGLTLVLSFLRILEFPLGTITAFYSFWVLFSQGGKKYFNERSARAEV